VDTPEEFAQGKAYSMWAVIALDRASLAPLEQSGRWTSLPSQPGRTPMPRFVWTDDYSSLFPIVLRW
jgi:hypothetical protein